MKNIIIAALSSYIIYMHMTIECFLIPILLFIWILLILVECEDAIEYHIDKRREAAQLRREIKKYE